MRNSSPSKLAKMLALDGVFFRGLDENRMLHADCGVCRIPRAVAHFVGGEKPDCHPLLADGLLLQSFMPEP
jgi:hypothetical protein